MANERHTCLISGCRRSIAVERIAARHNEWICPAHWRLVPKVLKRVKARHERLFRKFGFYPDKAAYARVWRKIVRTAQDQN